jgi:hypothetical protein
VGVGVQVREAPGEGVRVGVPGETVIGVTVVTVTVIGV